MAACEYVKWAAFTVWNNTQMKDKTETILFIRKTVVTYRILRLFAQHQLKIYSYRFEGAGRQPSFEA